MVKVLPTCTLKAYGWRRGFAVHGGYRALHNPTALSLRKEYLLYIEQDTWWLTELTCTIWRREKSLASDGIRTPGCRATVPAVLPPGAVQEGAYVNGTNVMLPEGAV